MRHPELKLLAALASGCSLLTGGAAHADTVSSVSGWNSTIETRFATPLSSGSVNTSFTAYSGTAVPYATGTFYVGSTGTFTVSLNAGNVGQGLQIIRGSFSPNAGGAPTTALADVLYGTQAGGGVTISNISLTRGQQYTYLQLFQGFTSGTNALFSLSGPGCISLGASNLCAPQYSRLTSPTTLASASRSSMLTAFEQISERLDVLRYATSPHAQAIKANTGENTKAGLWSKVYSNESQQNAQDSHGGHEGFGWGTSIGIDQDFGEGTLGGLAFSYSETKLSYTTTLAGNSNTIRSPQLSAYGHRDFGPFYLAGFAAYAQQTFDNRRDTILSGYANSTFNGKQWGARLEGGLPLHLSARTTLTPRLRLEWNRIKQDAYRESGGQTLAVSVAGNTVERLRAGLGAQLEHTIMLAGTPVRPHLGLYWLHDFENRGIDAHASFVDGSSSFVTTGQKLNRTTFSLTTGINFFARKNFSASLNYHLSASHGYLAQTAQASTHWSF